MRKRRRSKRWRSGELGVGSWREYVQGGVSMVVTNVGEKRCNFTDNGLTGLLIVSLDSGDVSHHFDTMLRVYYNASPGSSCGDPSLS